MNLGPVYDEEIAAGATPEEAKLIARSVRRSPVYRALWYGGRAERLREREEREEVLRAELDYPGNPRLEEL